MAMKWYKDIHAWFKEAKRRNDRVIHNTKANTFEAYKDMAGTKDCFRGEWVENKREGWLA